MGEQNLGTTLLLLPGSQTTEGSRTNTSNLTQLVVTFLHLRVSYLYSTLQFNKDFQPQLACG